MAYDLETYLHAANIHFLNTDYQRGVYIMLVQGIFQRTLKNFCYKLDLSQSISSSHHKQRNCQVESSIKFMKRMVIDV